jgi:sporulation protein YlmC with PRC-barrel domain
MNRDNSLPQTSRKNWLRGVAAAGLAATLTLGASGGIAYAAGSQTIGVSQDEMRTVERGWSVKKNIMDKAVYNDNNERIGSVDDLIISRNKSASFAIIGVGGFLGMGTHDVAVPMSRLKHEGKKLVLPGATKDALKAMPEFQYVRMDNRDTRTSKR